MLRNNPQAKDLMPPTATTDRYKWIALSNTTLGVLMATVNSSILLIALPDISGASTSTRSPPATRTTCCG